MKKEQMVGKSGQSVCRGAVLLVGLGVLLLPLRASAVDWTIGNTTVTAGGYVKLDTIYSRFSDGPVPQSTPRDFYLPNGTPAFATGVSAHSYLDFHAKETRLWFGTQTPFGQHNIGSYVEIDFISGQIPQVVLTPPAGAPTTAFTGSKIATNAYNPALRRAYITFDNHWLFGQDWSTFQNLAAYADVLDFIGPTDGTLFVRQPQVRYTYGGFQFSIETPETTVYPFGTFAFNKTDDNYFPDLVGRYNFKFGPGDFAVAVLGRLLKDAATVGTADDTSYGLGGTVSGKIAVLGKDDIRFMFTGGRGIGRYLAVATLGDAVVTRANELHSISVINAYVAYRHLWNQQWRSNVVVSALTGFNLGDNLAGAVTRRTGSALANLLYSPVTSMTLGGEFHFALREDVTGNTGNLARVQASAKYYF